MNMKVIGRTIGFYKYLWLLNETQNLFSPVRGHAIDPDRRRNGHLGSIKNTEGQS